MQNNNIISRPSWEVFIGEQNKVTTVGRLLNSTLKPVDALYQETKAKINKAKHDNSTHYLRCCYCNSNLYGRRSQQNTKQFTYYFCHHTPTDDAQRRKYYPVRIIPGQVATFIMIIAQILRTNGEQITNTMSLKH